MGVVVQYVGDTYGQDRRTYMRGSNAPTEEAYNNLRGHLKQQVSIGAMTLL